MIDDEALLEELSTDSEEISHSADRSEDRSFELEAIKRLGIRFSEYVMSLETQAREVWVFKTRRLRESDPGYSGELVLEALRKGVGLRYIFAPKTDAARSFNSEFRQWVESEQPEGRVTGYCVKNPRLAYDLGLSGAPVGWIVIEYQPEQASRLKRRFEVFVELNVREYLDQSRTREKNENGQPCWLELATPHAGEWINKLSKFRSKKKSDKDVDVITVGDNKN